MLRVRLDVDVKQKEQQQHPSTTATDSPKEPTSHNNSTNPSHPSLSPLSLPSLSFQPETLICLYLERREVVLNKTNKFGKVERVPTGFKARVVKSC